jgi:hypothetical protein
MLHAGDDQIVRESSTNRENPPSFSNSPLLPEIRKQSPKHLLFLIMPLHGIQLKAEDNHVKLT